MSRRRKLTNNSDETDISSLLSGDNVFAIPYFQRPYKWTSKRLKRLEEDILNIIDDVVDNHFLGAVIIHGRRSNPSEPTVYEVIDGQQRITTLFLYIVACIRVLCKIEQHDEAVALFQKYVSIGRNVGILSNSKLHPCKEDRQQLNRVYNDIFSDQNFKDRIGAYRPSSFPDTGSDTGKLLQNYRAAVRFFERQNEQGGLERIRDVYTAMLERNSVVQIDVWDPTDGPRIFDSLNSRQEPMTVGDLVRNEIFARVSDRNPDQIEAVDRELWQPFYKKFQVDGKNHFDNYFFPYGLIINPNVSKSEVFNDLRERWMHNKEPEQIISDLSVYQDAYLDLVTGGNRQGHETGIASRIARLAEIGVPSSVYPFYMRLLSAVKNGEVASSDAEQVLDQLESFFVRRAVIGVEPTGLHAVFKKLWSELDGEVNRQNVERQIKSHRTVIWPTDEQFQSAVRERPLYSVGITKYLIRCYDSSLGGDVPADIPWIEHVLPQSLTDSWREKFNEAQHKKMKDLLANLMPLSSEMNRSLSNGPYERKREEIKNDSMFKSARAFAEVYDEWNPTNLAKRADDLSAWAVARWKG